MRNATLNLNTTTSTRDRRSRDRRGRTITTTGTSRRGAGSTTGTRTGTGSRRRSERAGVRRRAATSTIGMSALGTAAAPALAAAGELRRVAAATGCTFILSFVVRTALQTLAFIAIQCFI